MLFLNSILFATTLVGFMVAIFYWMYLWAKSVQTMTELRYESERKEPMSQ